MLPVQIAADRWDTGVYDWRAIGAVADTVKMPVPSDPSAYTPGGQMDTMLERVDDIFGRVEADLHLLM